MNEMRSPQSSGGPFLPADCDGRRVAVAIVGTDGMSVLCGDARYEHDDRLGLVLRVFLDQDRQSGAENPRILIRESTFDGAIEVDRQFGCDYRITLHAAGHDAHKRTDQGTAPPGASTRASQTKFSRRR